MKNPKTHCSHAKQITTEIFFSSPKLLLINLFKCENSVQDPTRLRKFLRMSGETFDELLHKVAPYIEKQDTNWGMAIPAAERLAVTLRFLAQGISHVQYYDCRSWVQV